MASDPSSAIQYRGRKTSRSGSEQRRKSILEAALRIVISEGIRGVRHRAVAKEADVPLSATTYYFKDISDLIADTFTLFAEKNLSSLVDPFAGRIENYLGQFTLDDLRGRELRDSIVDELAEMTANLVCYELTEGRDNLLAEQAFLHEATIDKRLRDLARTYRRSLLEGGILSTCKIYNTLDPEADANILLNSVLNIEYEYLLKEPDEVDKAAIKERIIYLYNVLINNRLSVADEIENDASDSSLKQTFEKLG
jgi:DNA-binding transcriptional regulator YbjK